MELGNEIKFLWPLNKYLSNYVRLDDKYIGVNCKLQGNMEVMAI